MSDGERTGIAVVFEPEGVQVEVPAGTPMLRAANEAGIAIERTCGGLGVCGRCRVRYTEAAPEATPADRHFHRQGELDSGWRLACRHEVTEPTTVFVPDSSRSGLQQILQRGVGREVALEPLVRKIHLQLAPPTLQDERDDYQRLQDALAEAGAPVAMSDLTVLRDVSETLRTGKFAVTATVAGERLLNVESGDTTDTLIGVAIDLGSTTLVAYVLDLNTGAELGIASTMNPQVAYGDDLIARIHHAGNRAGRAELHRAIVEGIGRLVREACSAAKIRRRDVSALVCVGNTCMTHLFLGFDVNGLGIMPYVPVVRQAVDTTAAAVGLRLAPQTSVHVLPAIGGFVGADALAVTLTHLAEPSDAPRVALDIGTNGEMVLQHGERLWACSAAAGPAFEGARIEQGMRGAPGAIAAVRIDDGQIELATIDDAPPRGICGSGLLDAVAEMLRVGVLDMTGRLPRQEETARLPDWLQARLFGEGNQRAFVLATAEESGIGQPIKLTQADLREFQVAKASIQAALITLLTLAEVRAEQVEACYLAGAFGSYLNIDSALQTGLLPPFRREVIEAVGNAAGSGAKLALLSRAEWQRAGELAARMEHIVLSTHPQYQESFVEAMIFPVG